jgi:hypothetical protein
MAENCPTLGAGTENDTFALEKLIVKFHSL